MKTKLKIKSEQFFSLAIGVAVILIIVIAIIAFTLNKYRNNAENRTSAGIQNSNSVTQKQLEELEQMRSTQKVKVPTQEETNIELNKLKELREQEGEIVQPPANEEIQQQLQQLDQIRNASK